MSNILNNLDTLTIEGHPFKDMVIDAIVGAGFSTIAFAQWATAKGIARFNGNQHNESWAWNRAELNAMEAEDLMRLYARIKGPV